MIRSIKLKLVVPRNNDELQIRKNLWLTHQLLNDASKFFSQYFLLLRGRSYLEKSSKGDLISHDEKSVQEDCLKWLRSVQSANGGKCGSDEEVLIACRKLYELLVPSSISPESEGDAQSSLAYLRPLVDGQSKGGMSGQDKCLHTTPAWILAKNNSEEGWEKLSLEWAKSPEFSKIYAASKLGRPARWVVLYEKGEAWQEDFIKSEKKQKASMEDGAGSVILKLRSLNILPLLASPVQSKFSSSTRARSVSSTDVVAFKSTIGHLLAWESQNWIIKADLEKAKEDYANLAAKFRENHSEEVQAMLEDYEETRHAGLMEVSGLSLEEKPYKISLRSLRGYKMITQSWIENQANSEKRLGILNEYLDKQKKDVGDPVIFQFLANHPYCWKNNAIIDWAKVRDKEWYVNERKEMATFSYPDAKTSLRYPEYEPKGGSNLSNYDLAMSDKGLPLLTIPLLQETKDGVIESKACFLISQSNQFDQISIESDGKKYKLKYKSGADRFDAVARAINLMFDRDEIEHMKIEDLREGKFKGVYIKLVLDIEPKAPKEWINKMGNARPSYLTFMQTALNNTKESLVKPSVGERFMSVHLNISSFATASIFECFEEDSKEVNQSKLSFKIPQTNLVAVHERTFNISMQGDTPSKRDVKERQIANNEIDAQFETMDLLQSINRLRGIRQLDSNANIKDDLQKILDKLSEKSLINIKKSNDHLSKGIDEGLSKLYYELQSIIASGICKFRTEQSPRSRDRAYKRGKSIWGMDYLQRLQILMKGWHYHSDKPRVIKRANVDKEGHFSARLSKHIQDLKDDRIKTGAELLVKAARGLIRRDDGFWVEKLKPCRVILMRDIEGALVDVGRSKKENRLLARWGYRSIVERLRMDAVLFGIHVYDEVSLYGVHDYRARDLASLTKAIKLTPENFYQGKLRKNTLDNIITPAKEYVVGSWYSVKNSNYRIVLADVNKKAPVVPVNQNINTCHWIARQFFNRYTDLLTLELEKTECGHFVLPETIGVRNASAITLKYEMKASEFLMSQSDSGKWVVSKNQSASIKKMKRLKENIKLHFTNEGWSEKKPIIEKQLGRHF